MGAAIDEYRKHYADIQFERAGLFRTIKKKYGCNDVLYPGSSVHITPSFFFPHVVYVDQHPMAEEFFAETRSALDYIDRSKAYKQSPYIRFIPQDFSKTLPLQEGKFDLLISLFAGAYPERARNTSGSAASC